VQQRRLGFGRQIVREQDAEKQRKSHGRQNGNAGQKDPEKVPLLPCSLRSQTHHPPRQLLFFSSPRRYALAYWSSASNAQPVSTWLAKRNETDKPRIAGAGRGLRDSRVALPRPGAR